MQYIIIWYSTLQAISCHYANSNCYYIDVRGTTQEVIAKEVLDIAAKRLGTSEVTYQVCFKMITGIFYRLSLHQQDVWKFRSRLVHGKEGSLTIDA